MHAIPDPASSQIENHKGLGPAAYLIGWFGYFENFEFNPNSYVIDPWREIRVNKHIVDNEIRVFHYGDTRSNMLGKQEA